MRYLEFNCLKFTYHKFRCPVHLPLQFHENIFISVPFAMDNFIKNERMNSSLSKQYTKLSIRLKSGQTKHKRPILFIVPAEASNSKLTYSLHGKDKDLFGLREESDGIQALFYKQKVSSVIQGKKLF